MDALIREAVQAIKRYPETWQRTDIPGVRAKIVRDYLLFYQISNQEILILSIWDGHRDPDTLRL